MSIRELTLRMSAEDVGVSRVFNRVSKDLEKLRKDAADSKIEFTPEFRKQQIDKEVEHIVARMQKQADAHTVKIEAELIARQAHESVFGPAPAGAGAGVGAGVGVGASRGPLRSIDRSGFEQDVRDAQAAQIRAMRDSARRSNVKEEAMRRLFGEPAELAAEGEKTGRAAGEATSRGFLRELGRTLGGRSEAGNLLKLLRGAGPIAAVGLGAAMLGRMGDAANSLAEKIGRGEINQRQLNEQIRHGVPILGNLSRFAEGLYGFLSGATAEAARLKAQAEAAARAWKTIEELRKDSPTVRGIDRASAAGLAANPEEAERIAAKNRRDDTLSQLAEDEKAAAEKYEKVRGDRNASAYVVNAALAELEGIQEEHNRARLAIEENYQRELRQITLKGQRQRFDMADEMGRDAADADRELARQRLRDAGNDLDAEIDQLRQASEERVRIRREAYLKERDLAASPGERAMLDDAFGGFKDAQRRKLDSDIDTAARKDSEAAREAVEAAKENAARKEEQRIRDRETIERRLGDLRLGTLEAEARLGDKAAEKELKRLQIAEEYRQKREQINQILQDESASEEQKARARAAGGRLTEDELVAQALAGLDQQRSTYRAPTMNESRFLTGVGAGAAAEHEAAAARDRKEQIKAAKETAKLLNRVVTLMERTPGILRIFPGV